MVATPPKAPYDPVKVIEGMFNGSVTRIGYALKDPNNYGSSTKTILAECAKRFQDALDDCEIQLLDAKWYLEDLLRQNKERREEQERQRESNSAALKRKHEEAHAKTEPMDIGSPAKRSKSDTSDTKQEAGTETKAQLASRENAEAKSGDKASSQPPTRPEQKSNEESVKKDGDNTNKDKPPAETENKPDAAPDPAPTSVDDLMNLKQTPNDTPAATNDDFNFESMFEPDADDPANDDMNLDLGLGDTFTNDPTITQNLSSSLQDPSSLVSLGLDSFGNPNGDDLNLNDAANNQFSGNFDLPDLGGSNTFDDFLNDDTLGGDFGGNTNFEGDVDLSEEALNNLSFDEMFGDSI